MRRGGGNPLLLPFEQCYYGHVAALGRLPDHNSIAHGHVATLETELKLVQGYNYANTLIIL